MAIVMGEGSKSDACRAAIVEAAQDVYCDLLRSGVARTRQCKRFDAGTHRAGRQGSHAQWNRDRKQALDEAVSQCSTPLRRPRQELPESLEKERDFQKEKERKRKAEAFNDGLLLEDEATDDVKRLAAKVIQENRQKDAQRAKACAKYKQKAKLACRKKPRQWALKDLQGPAWFSKKFSNHARAEAEERLQNVGITDFTEASWRL